MKILVVHKHALIRDALRALLTQLIDTAEVLEAADGQQAMRLILEYPDIQLILLNLKLPDQDGLTMLEDLRNRHAAISLVVLSAMPERDVILKALDLGARGFIPMSATREVVINALRLIIAGGVYVPPEPPPSPSLTARQREVLAHSASAELKLWKDGDRTHPLFRRRNDV